ncbi:S8 family serine peptidase [Stenotrophomonas acidaminiphila]|uniref:S8 family serine peptidase n=1 Tax=Stenotrophomonas acidaminiphila TaxID=128780 RepID=UPI002ABD9992|nr:S8 family serine peptidase [Stenotrophomonas acidaminiphila]WPU55900.1 S8 family serine peptidase [Stenotrophomonas acidaminiphila]
MNRSLLAATIASCLILSACGGGGNTKSDAPPSNPPPANPPPSNPPPPGNPPPSDPPPSNPPPEAKRYNGEPDNLLVPANVDLAHKAGAKGAGVRVAVMDDFLQASYGPLVDRVAYYKDYTPSPDTPESPDNLLRGHGTIVSAVLLGNATEGFNGGVAPDADLHYARICSENKCTSIAARTAAVDMAAAGVRIVNLSLGTQRETEADAAIAAAGWRHAMDPIIQAGGLVIASTGNDGKTTPSFPAAAPTVETSLRNNWLAVGAVDLDADGKPTTLSSYSNHCGAAADFCLVAPGLYTAPALPDTEYKGRVAGTSVAAPAVTGVVALVSGVYPWMNGSQLQQTVLTTATDLGDAGVDAVFGWGMIDAAKAINGPAAFLTNWGVGVTGESTFSNDISGTGSLTKNGAGKLTLSGNNTYTGSTTVLDGTLGLSGSVTSDVLVGNNATFESHGGKINGNYGVVNTTGNTAIELGKSLDVTGQASIKGNLILLPEASDYTVGGTEKVLTSGALTGTFDSVNYANGFFWTATLDYDAKDVSANLTRASAEAGAHAIAAPQSVIDGGRQADALIASLDQLVRNGETANIGGLLSATGSLLSVSDAHAAASLTTLTGQVHGVERTLGVTTAMNDLRVAGDRLPLLAGTLVPTAWVQGEYVDGELARNGYAPADYTTSAMTVGVDVPVGSAETVIGGALTAGRNRADIAASASRLDANRIAVTGYVYHPIHDAYVSGVVSYGQSDVDTVRTVMAGNVSERISANRDDDVFSVRIEAGLNLLTGLSPFVAVGNVSHKQKAFSEASASGLGLTAGADSANVTFADVGVRFRQEQGAWSFDSLLAYRNVFDGRNTDFTAWFTGLQDAKFTVAGQPVSADAVRAAFGVGYKVSPSLMLYGNAGAERGAGNSSNVTANAGVRWKF